MNQDHPGATGATMTGLYDDWDVIEPESRQEENGRNESIFALGNGYLGMRGTFEEGQAAMEGTYINGFYESVPLKYPEAVYACAQFSQTMLNITNGKIIRLYLDGEPFSVCDGTLLDYGRVLHLRTGILECNPIWCSPQGRKIRPHTRRLVFFATSIWRPSITK
jgi:alpha,alpha-trehalose phosphorylase